MAKTLVFGHFEYNMFRILAILSAIWIRILAILSAIWLRILAILSAIWLRPLKTFQVCVYKSMSGNHVKYAGKLSKLSPFHKQCNRGCNVSYPFALKSEDIATILT